MNTDIGPADKAPKTQVPAPAGGDSEYYDDEYYGEEDQD